MYLVTEFIDVLFTILLALFYWVFIHLSTATLVFAVAFFLGTYFNSQLTVVIVSFYLSSAIQTFVVIWMVVQQVLSN